MTSLRPISPDIIAAKLFIAIAWVIQGKFRIVTTAAIMRRMRSWCVDILAFSAIASGEIDFSHLDTDVRLLQIT